MKKNVFFTILCLMIFFSSSIIAAEAAGFSFISYADTNGGISTLSFLSPKARAMNASFSIFQGDLEDDGVEIAEIID